MKHTPDTELIARPGGLQPNALPIELRLLPSLVSNDRCNCSIYKYDQRLQDWWVTQEVVEDAIPEEQLEELIDHAADYLFSVEAAKVTLLKKLDEMEERMIAVSSGELKEELGEMEQEELKELEPEEME
jgi:hypothetical protein